MVLIKEKLINASEEWIWDKLIDVENWSGWDVEVKESRLYTPFDKGAKGYLIDQDNMRSEFEITFVSQGESYGNVYFIAEDVLLNFSHIIIGDSHPYLIKFEAFFSGKKAEEYYVNYHKVILLTMENALSKLATLADSQASFDILAKDNQINF